MAVPATTYINKVPQNISGQYFILKTEFPLDEIRLQVLNTQSLEQWEGSVSYDSLKQSAEELEIQYDKFFDECKQALTRNGGAEHFEYLLEDSKFILLKKDQFQIRYVQINLTSNTEFKSEFALAAVDLIASLRTDLSQCQKSSKELEEKYQTMVTTVEKHLKEKNHLEKNLLSKFAVLLNSKKDKIAELKALLVEKDKLLEDAGISSEENGLQKRRKSKDCSIANDGDSQDEDFMQPTQPMTQPVAKTLPKRVKLGS